MDFLANENIPIDTVLSLRRAGHHVYSISEKSSGMKDIDVLKKAIRDKSVILTFDRDYGELIFMYPRFIPTGIVYLRFEPQDSYEPAHMLLNVLKRKDIKLQNYFTVIERDGIRQRALS